MKKGVILVGLHHAGKSKAIRVYLKPMLKISHSKHKFTLSGRRGFILSQSFEEGERDVAAVIKKYSGYDLLVLAARPDIEPGSKLLLLRRTLAKTSFPVRTVNIQNEGEAQKKAREVFDLLK